MGGEIWFKMNLNFRGGLNPVGIQPHNWAIYERGGDENQEIRRKLPWKFPRARAVLWREKQEALQPEWDTFDSRPSRGEVVEIGLPPPVSSLRLPWVPSGTQESYKPKSDLRPSGLATPFCSELRRGISPKSSWTICSPELPKSWLSNHVWGIVWGQRFDIFKPPLMATNSLGNNEYPGEH